MMSILIYSCRSQIAIGYLSERCVGDGLKSIVDAIKKAKKLRFCFQQRIFCAIFALGKQIPGPAAGLNL